MLPPSRRALLRAAAVTPLALALSSCSKGNRSTPAMRLLFIGNSYTQFNGTVPSELQRLAPHTTTRGVLHGGYHLTDHAASQETFDAINDGHWDAVVLQEQSVDVVRDPVRYASGLGRLVPAIRKAGSEPWLFATWTRPDVTGYQIERSVQGMANQFGARPVHVGRAFDNASLLRPTLALTIADGHPTPAGTYLAACVFFQTAFGINVAGNSEHGSLNEDDAAFLQGIADASA